MGVSLFFFIARNNNIGFLGARIKEMKAKQTRTTPPTTAKATSRGKARQRRSKLIKAATRFAITLNKPALKELERH